VGLDIYAGPVTRYVAGDWLTVVQQAGKAAGIDVRVDRWVLQPGQAGPPGQDGGLNVEVDGVAAVVRRRSEPSAQMRDVRVVGEIVKAWQGGLLGALGVTTGWREIADAEYATDKPDWDGYGAVVLLAAYDEQPGLAPGSARRDGLRRTVTPGVSPRRFGEAAAFTAAHQVPRRYPTLLRGAEWCLPISDGPLVYRAPAPNGTQIPMGRVDRLVTELQLLNDRILQLSPADLSAARQAGPPEPAATVEQAAPFGLSIMLALAEFAVTHQVAWIMDY
jgi:hypothetical protein